MYMEYGAHVDIIKYSQGLYLKISVMSSKTDRNLTGKDLNAHMTQLVIHLTEVQHDQKQYFWARLHCVFGFQASIDTVFRIPPYISTENSSKIQVQIRDNTQIDLRSNLGFLSAFTLRI